MDFEETQHPDDEAFVVGLDSLDDFGTDGKRVRKRRFKVNNRTAVKEVDRVIEALPADQRQNKAVQEIAVLQAYRDDPESQLWQYINSFGAWDKDSAAEILQRLLVKKFFVAIREVPTPRAEPSELRTVEVAPQPDPPTAYVTTKTTKGEWQRLPAQEVRTSVDASLDALRAFCPQARSLVSRYAAFVDLSEIDVALKHLEARLEDAAA